MRFDDLLIIMAYRTDEATRRHAERELATLEHSQAQVVELERDRDALLASYAEMVPEALDELTGAERNQVYRMLRHQVTPAPDGFEVTGTLRSVLHFETDELEEVSGIGPKTLEKIKPFAEV